MTTLEINTDLADRQRAEQERRESEQRLRLALKAARMGTWDWDLQTGAQVVSPEAEALFGFAPGTYRGEAEQFYGAIHAEDRTLVQRATEVALSSGTLDVEHRVVWPDGSVHWIAGQGLVVRDAQRRPVRMIGVVSDLSERKRAEDERAQLLREQMARAEAEAAQHRIGNILESITDAFFALDPQGRFTYVNRETERFVGRSRHELLGRNVWEAFPEALGTPFYEHYRQWVVAPGARLAFEEYYAPLDAWLEVRAYPGPEGISVYFRDVTERKRAEDVLRVLAQGPRAFAEAGLDLRATLETITRYITQVLGDGAVVFLVSEDGHGFDPAAVYHPQPEAVALVRDVLAATSSRVDEGLPGRVLQSGQPLLIPTIGPDELRRVGLRPEYQPYWQRFAVRGLVMVPLWARGRVIGTLGAWRDRPGCPYTTDDQRLLQALADHAALAIENARLYQQTQAAVRARDEVLSVVSHDLKTQLAAIKVTAQNLERRACYDLPDRDRLVEGLRRINTSTIVMDDWIEELLDAARLEMGQQLTLREAPTELVALVHAAVADYQQTTQEHALRVEAMVPRLVGRYDAARLRRVLSNLLANAVKYSPKGGEITVTIARQDDAEGAWAVLQVRDRGIGIPLGEQAHIFERFQRGSNVVGRIAGMGIGLTGARQIVEQHGGSMGVDSQEGVGSTFTVRLPLAAPPEDGRRTGA